MRYFFWAISFISIIPIPKKYLVFDETFYKSIGYFPMAGAFLGLIAYLLFLVFSFFFSVNLSLLMSIFLYHILNGGLHLDGYADFSDAFFGAKKNKSRFKEILKDSRIGTMGAFALFFYFSVVFKITDILVPDLYFFVFLGMAGRVTIVNCATFSKPLFNEGLGRIFIEKAGLPEFITGNLFFFILSLVMGWKYLLTALIIFIFSFIFKYMILRSYEGFSGDLFGAGCIFTEIIVFLMFIKG
ncbi:MAG: adenosylcobinamide-GDP ribazoletransferase [Proteobacteria bacterium]|nr:adenosylcobinamide-GDP ribazoletransferase [Pseudomonadota bacterium]